MDSTVFLTAVEIEGRGECQIPVDLAVSCVNYSKTK